MEDSTDESSEADDEFEDEAGMENVDESDLEESGDDADEHTPTRAGKKGKRNGKGKSSRSKGKRNKARKKSDRKKGKEENAMKLQAPGGFEMDINADLEADNSMHALPSVILTILIRQRKMLGRFSAHLPEQSYHNDHDKPALGGQ